ncbi:galacturonan 1,4-alpha-galacturonidase [Salvia divinorum]|uniref:Galacturonan 1,4-alpha-galacturonidase n=1 Tax=Salvia divinorum TaxID=28513 RepID=A0ABD1GLB9_SALDI
MNNKMILSSFLVLQLLLKANSLIVFDISKLINSGKPDPDSNRPTNGVTINYVNFLTISGGGVLDEQGQQAWNCNKIKNCPKLPINLSLNSIIQDITTKDSKKFHVNCISSHNVTFKHFTVSAPEDRPNTGDIHIARGNRIRVSDVLIENDQDVALHPSHTHHLGHPVVNVRNPVIFDQLYCPWNPCSLDKPSLIKISNVEIMNIKGTTSTKEGLIFSCSKAKPCDNIRIGAIDLKHFGKTPATITTRRENIKPILSAKQNLPICSDSLDSKPPPK